MKHLVCLLLLLQIGSTVVGQSLEEKIDAYMDVMAKRYEIPGAAVAVIQKGKLIHEKYYGMADVERQIDVSKQTRFKLHSLSKVFVSTAIFQLIENGQLTLEDEIQMYMDGLPDTWKKVKIKHLLSHSSGLPNMIFFDAENEEKHKAKVFSGAIEFQPGARFHYNQTNFWLLNRIIAKVTGTSLEKFLTEQQFNGEKNALVFSRDKGVQERAVEYFPNKEGVVEPKMYDIPEYMYGAAGIAATLGQMVAWNDRLDKNNLITSMTKAKMWAPFAFQNGHDFAYGWGREKLNKELSVGFSGGTIVSLKKYIDQDLTVIVLTNGYKYFPDVNAMASFIAGFATPILQDERALIREKLYDSFLNEPLEKALKTYKEKASEGNSLNLESSMNSIGYALAGRKLFDKAIAVFLVNSKEHPKSWNVWDSLAEGYEMAGDLQKAIVHYKKSIELNPENTHGIEKIKMLQEKIK